MAAAGGPPSFRRVKPLGSERLATCWRRGVPVAAFVGMRAAVVGRVDRVFYSLKRAYHSTLRLSRRDCKELGNTPARIDILHALSKSGRRGKPPIWQSSLRRTIGYTARSTISELLKELEALRWVHRKRSKEDKRQVEVALTEWGRWALRQAYLRFCNGWTLEGPSQAKGWGQPLSIELDAWDAYLMKMVPLDRILRNIRFALRDTGCLRYRWFSD